MTTQVQDIQTLNFGEKTINVSDASPAIQNLVRLFNVAQKREARLVEEISELNDEIVLTRGAKDAIYREINVVFSHEQKQLEDVTLDTTASNESTTEVSPE